MAITPNPNLNPEAMPWAREVTSNYESLVRSQDLIKSDVVAQNKQLTTSINLLSVQQRAGLGNVYTKAETDALIQSVQNALGSKADINHGHDQSQISGTWTKEVNTGSAVRGNAGLYSTGVYNNSVTYGGQYRAVWVHVDGTVGYAPSSRKFKQDIKTADLSFDKLMQLRVVFFRYIAAVENMDAEAQRELGVIAEEVHELGFKWLIDYDEEGEPFGIKHERMAFAALKLAQLINNRVDSLEERLEELESSVGN